MDLRVKASLKWMVQLISDGSCFRLSAETGSTVSFTFSSFSVNQSVLIISSQPWKLENYFLFLKVIWNSDIITIPGVEIQSNDLWCLCLNLLLVAWHVQFRLLCCPPVRGVALMVCPWKVMNQDFMRALKDNSVSCSCYQWFANSLKWGILPHFFGIGLKSGCDSSIIS